MATQYAHCRTTRFLLLICTLSAAAAGPAPASEPDMLEEYRAVLEVESLAQAYEEALLDGWAVLAGDVVAGQAQAVDKELWAVETAQAHDAGLCSTPEASRVSLLSPIIPLPGSCRAVLGAVIGSGAAPAEVLLLWMQGDEMLDAVTFRAPAAAVADGLRRYNLSETDRPTEADGARLLLAVDPDGGKSACWHSARLTGLFEEQRYAQLHLNRVGYELTGPKTFTVSVNFDMPEADFHILNAEGIQVFDGKLPRAERIQGVDGAPWDGYHSRGDFSALDIEGAYLLTVLIEELPPLEAPFRIGFHLLWEQTIPAALAPFKAQRSEAYDDEGQPRLWEDAGLNKSSDAAMLWDLVRSWSIVRGRFSHDAAFAALQEEVVYGVKRLIPHILHGNLAPHGVNEEFLLHAAAIACFARYAPPHPETLAAARTVAERIIMNNISGPLAFSVVMDLYRTTNEDRYYDYVERHFPGASLERVEPLLEYEGLTERSVTVDLSHLFARVADRLLATAENPYGLVQTEAFGASGFFIWGDGAPEPRLGNNARLLEAVNLTAQALRYAAKIEYRTLVYDQFNWLLGNNPYGVCLMEGVTEAGAPQLALPEGKTRDEAHGVVLHGIGPGADGEDTPFFDMTTEAAVQAPTNGYSLHNNARYISAMAYLKRIPVARP